MNKNAKRKVLSACLAGTVLCGTVAPVAAASVTNMRDVKQQDWYYTFVKDVMEKNYMVGVSQDQFAPQVKMTRAMFITAVSKLAGVKAGAATTTPTFTDVAKDAWYANSVVWAAKNGIVAGVGANKFNPDGEITREQMCLIMNQFIKYWNKQLGYMVKVDVKPVEFKDGASISSYAKDAVYACMNLGLVVGFEDQTFRPQNASTRAEVATVMSKLSALLRTSGGGGGGGSYTPSTVTHNESYAVKAQLKVPSSVSSRDTLELVAANYPVSMQTQDGVIVDSSITGEVPMGEIAGAMVSGDNADAIQTAIQIALDKTQGTTVKTVNVGSNKAEVTVEDGTISLKVMVPADKILGGGSDDAQTLALPEGVTIDISGVSMEDIESLVNKLQDPNTDMENLVIEGNDLAAMEKLIQKAEELQDKTPEEVQQIVDDYVAEKPELEKVVGGMKPEEIKQAASDYKDQLHEVQTTVIEEIKQANGGELPTTAGGQLVIPTTPVEVPKPATPVALWVKYDLGHYYDVVMDEYLSGEKKEAYMDKVATKLQDQLGLQWNQDLEEALNEAYDLNNPEMYVEKNGDGTLSVLEAEDYLGMIQANVYAATKFYDALKVSDYIPAGEEEAQPVDEVFYEGLIELLNEKNAGRVKYELTPAAPVMATGDCLFVDHANNALRGDTVLFHIKGEADEGDYTRLVDALLNRGGRVGSLAEKLPEVMPEVLNKLLGEYELTVTLDALSNNG